MNVPAATRPVTRIAALALGLLAATALAVLLAPGDTGAIRHGPWWLVALIGAAFVAAELVVFHLELRREAITFSLSEVPSIYALVFLDIRVAVAVRVVTGLAVFYAQRRPVAYKLLFNGALFAFETAAAAALLRIILRSADDSTTGLLAGGVVAVGTLTALGSIVVSAAIAQFEGGFVDRVMRDLGSRSLVYPLNAIIAGLALAPALMSPWLAPFALAPIAMFWLFMRQQATVSQNLRDVEELHGFAGRVAGEVELTAIADVAVTETARLLRARRVTLVVLDGDEIVMTSSTGEVIGALASASAGAIVRLVGDRTPEGPAAAGQDDIRVAAVHSDHRLVAAIAISGRDGASDSFTQADVERLRTIADQLASPVARGLLHRHLEIEARHDPLTGLVNRAGFERALTGRAGMPPDAEVMFLAMFDLDRFKEVNDTLGHHAGDQLLIEIARRLEMCIGPDDVLARLAGDEFAITGSRTSLDEIGTFVRRCGSEVARAIRLEDLELVINASIGIATGSDGVDAATLLRRADIAMYHAKQNHLGHEFYRREIDRRTPARLSMLADLRTAIERGELDFHLQPKVDIVTDVVAGAEVLARWHHPTRGWVPPSDFIAVAEQGGLIRAITDLVLEGTIRTIAALDAAGYRLDLAMNLSAQDLLDELVGDRIMHRIERHGVDPRRLTLEITEGTLLYDSPRTRATIARMHEIGVNLSIDDFGTGYSSLSYLRRLPVSELKIDRNFITNLVVDAQDETIVKSIIDLGHNLGLQVVAEGVETNEVGDKLRALGCDLAQGFGICRPIPLPQFMTWLGNTAYTTRRHDPADPRTW